MKFNYHADTGFLHIASNNNPSVIRDIIETDPFVLLDTTEMITTGNNK